MDKINTQIYTFPGMEHEIFHQTFKLQFGKEWVTLCSQCISRYPWSQEIPLCTLQRRKSFPNSTWQLTVEPGIILVWIQNDKTMSVHYLCVVCAGYTVWRYKYLSTLIRLGTKPLSGAIIIVIHRQNWIIRAKSWFRHREGCSYRKPCRLFVYS